MTKAMLNLLNLTHVFLGLSALGVGAAVCTRMVKGRPFEIWVKHFLEFSLSAASVGLILSVNHTSMPQLLTMLTVYVSGFAVLSWRKYGSSESWGQAVVLSTMCVLCLDTLIMIAHIIKLLVTFNILGSSQPDIALAVSMVAVVTLFAVLSTTALKNIHQHSSDSIMHKAVR